PSSYEFFDIGALPVPLQLVSHLTEEGAGRDFNLLASIKLENLLVVDAIDLAVVADKFVAIDPTNFCWPFVLNFTK
uniref:Uncharacterized protein n=1 Tax=Romanomermis culicivorax TaxID=13658 RepID=A0A915IJA2_ROMCU